MKKLILPLIFLVATMGVVRAESPVSSIFDGAVLKQAYVYIPKDAKSKNYTAVEVFRLNNIASLGKLNLLTNGLCIDAGVNYDAIAKQTIDDGAVMFGKHLNPVLDALNISYPWKGNWDATVYFGGDSFSKDGGKWKQKYAIGGAFVQVTIKI
jgi:hypothetical protein